MHGSRRSSAVVLLIALTACSALPGYWVDGHDDGGCGKLLSELSVVEQNSGGMLAQGYERVEEPSWSPAYDPGTGLWVIPLSTNGMGWFVTAKGGSFSGAGAPDDTHCPGNFRSSLSEERDLTTGQLIPLYWRSPSDTFGFFRIEVAFANALGVMYWYSFLVEVVPVPPLPPSLP